MAYSSTSDEAACSRRRFVAASGLAALVGVSALQLSAAESPASAATDEATDFPSSYLDCSPTQLGIRVRVQMECRGCVTNVKTGQSDEYVMGVMAKTGLSPDARTGKLAPGYDYSIIFSKTHIFTKRSHSSAYLNNPTTLTHEEFGAATWHLNQVRAKRAESAAEIREAIAGWRRMTAKTIFTSSDSAQQFAVEYPIKWADYSLKTDAFRVETGPIFLLNADKQRAGLVPKFEDFQWAHVDFKSFDEVRCLLERPTSIFGDATFSPPSEDGRERRSSPALTERQVAEIEDALKSDKRISVPAETVASLLSTDHYSLAADMSVKNEVYIIL